MEQTPPTQEKPKDPVQEMLLKRAMAREGAKAGMKRAKESLQKATESGDEEEIMKANEAIESAKKEYLSTYKANYAVAGDAFETILKDTETGVADRERIQKEIDLYLVERKREQEIELAALEAGFDEALNNAFDTSTEAKEVPEEKDPFADFNTQIDDILANL